MEREPPQQHQTKHWCPISSIERRVLGVLAEKAKTTPDAYPLSVNALCVGCNQKSNRHPKMSLEQDRLLDALDHLRELGAVAEVHGDSRIARFRHFLYQWLEVDKVQLAVMAELLLRGEQTLGELRGRAARMEPIADVAALRPVVEDLMQKNLVVALTSPGRGQIVTHNLYLPEELAKLRAKHGAVEHGAVEHGPADIATEQSLDAEPASLPIDSHLSAPTSNPAMSPDVVSSPRPTTTGTSGDSGLARELREEVFAFREQLVNLQEEVSQLREDVSQLRDQVRQMLGN